MTAPLISYRALYLGLKVVFCLILIAFAVAEFYAQRPRKDRRPVIHSAPFTDERSSLEVFKRMFPKEPR